jgi:hypothetical protein
MYALNAITLKRLYATSQAENGRDCIRRRSFCDSGAADGKVSLVAQANLLTYGLFGASKF